MNKEIETELYKIEIKERIKKKKNHNYKIKQIFIVT